jgi:uracil phosphoribosyltransferase
LIATGGTAVAALHMLTEWGLKQNQIKIVSILGSEEGVGHVTSEFPDVEVSYSFTVFSGV